MNILFVYVTFTEIIIISTQDFFPDFGKEIYDVR